MKKTSTKQELTTKLVKQLKKQGFDKFYLEEVDCRIKAVYYQFNRQFIFTIDSLGSISWSTSPEYNPVELKVDDTPETIYNKATANLKEYNAVNTKTRHRNLMIATLENKFLDYMEANMKPEGVYDYHSMLSVVHNIVTRALDFDGRKI